VYLNAAALGDVPIIRQSLEETNEISLNVNCVDYMGRSALHLAVDSESMEAVELLLDRINFECIEESLLHAISKGATKIVKVSLKMPLPGHCWMVIGESMESRLLDKITTVTRKHFPMH